VKDTLTSKAEYWEPLRYENDVIFNTEQ